MHLLDVKYKDFLTVIASNAYSYYGNCRRETFSFYQMLSHLISQKLSINVINVSLAFWVLIKSDTHFPAEEFITRKQNEAILQLDKKNILYIEVPKTKDNVDSIVPYRSEIVLNLSCLLESDMNIHRSNMDETNVI